jgi:hypothetical protein
MDRARSLSGGAFGGTRDGSALTRHRRPPLASDAAQRADAAVLRQGAAKIVESCPISKYWQRLVLGFELTGPDALTCAERLSLAVVPLRNTSAESLAALRRADRCRTAGVISE